MIPEPTTSHDMLQTRRGERIIRVVIVQRNVRIYTPDFINSATSWATRTAGVRGKSPQTRLLSPVTRSRSELLHHPPQADPALRGQFQDAHGSPA